MKTAPVLFIIGLSFPLIGCGSDGGGAEENASCVETSAPISSPDVFDGEILLSEVEANTIRIFGVNENNRGISMTLFEGYGVFSAGFVTGTFLLEGEELDPSECGICIRVVEGSEGAWISDGGTVTIESLTPQVDGSISATTSGITLAGVNPSFSGAELDAKIPDCSANLIDFTIDDITMAAWN